ncbi:MAG: 4Fe-4S binding protein [Candidatus Methanoperedens sp.]|nr:4Fe-4S binding protein [Candidatus Methanoperedens sp.]
MKRKNDKIRYAPAIADLKGCASGKSGFKGCTLCENACMHDAITRSGDNITFDEISCTGCGACASACPLSLFRMEENIYYKMDSILGSLDHVPEKTAHKILMFTCEHNRHLLDAKGPKKIKYPAVLPLFVPDLAGISETHILRAFDLGADGVIISGCDECTGQFSKVTSGLARQILDEFNLGGRLSIIKNIKNTKSLARSIESFCEQITPSPLRMFEPVVLKNVSNRQILIELISSLAAKTGIVPHTVIENATMPFADISISSSCTVCGACTSMCTAGALGRDEGSISYMYGNCIACGLCEQACPEKALTMKRVLDMKKLIDNSQSTIFRSEQQECASCRKPYMTRAAFERISCSFIENVRDDIGPKEQIELIRNQTELLTYCENCRPARAIMRMEVLS